MRTGKHPLENTKNIANEEESVNHIRTSRHHLLKTSLLPTRRRQNTHGEKSDENGRIIAPLLLRMKVPFPKKITSIGNDENESIIGVSITTNTIPNEKSENERKGSMSCEGIYSHRSFNLLDKKLHIEIRLNFML